MALWAFIVEIVCHASEVYRGVMSFNDTKGIFISCTVMIVWMSALYKTNLLQKSIKEN